MGQLKNNGKASYVARFVLESWFLKILQNFNVNYAFTFHSAIELELMKICQFCIV